MDAWQVLAAAGLAGFGLGLGLLVGAFAVRRLRRFMVVNNLPQGAVQAFQPTISVNTGTVTIHASNNRGGYCLIEDIGPVNQS